MKKKANNLYIEFEDFSNNKKCKISNDLINESNDEFLKFINFNNSIIEENDWILTKKPIFYEPQNIINLIKDTIKHNIFFTDIKTQRNKLKAEALKRIENFENEIYMDNLFSKKYKEKLLILTSDITKIYNDVNQYRIENDENKECDTKKSYKLQKAIESLSILGITGGFVLIVINPLLLIINGVGGLSALVSSALFGKKDKKKLLKKKKKLLLNMIKNM